MIFVAILLLLAVALNGHSLLGVLLCLGGAYLCYRRYA